MRKHGMPESHATHPNVVPLIDIIMCLIIFYMLVAKIGVSTGAEASIIIPISQLGTDQKKIGIESSCVLNIREVDGKPFVTATIEADGSPSKGKPVELKLIDPTTGKEPLLTALRVLRFGKDGKPGGTGNAADNDQFKVIIRGDKDLSYAALEPVLSACAAAQVKNVNFQAGKPKG